MKRQCNARTYPHPLISMQNLRPEPLRIHQRPHLLRDNLVHGLRGLRVLVVRVVFAVCYEDAYALECALEGEGGRGNGAF